MNLNSRQIKDDLAEEVLRAARMYANSMAGAAAFQSRPLIIRVPGTNIVQIQVPTNGGPAFFEISIKEAR